jgi:hypothetical protein
MVDTPRLAKLSDRKPASTRTPEDAAKVKAARQRLAKRPSRRVGSFAMIQPQLSTISTVAAKQIGSSKPQAPSRYDHLWQPMAYDFAASVGELGYPLNLTANAVAACNLVIKELPQELTLPGEPLPDWIDSENAAARRVMDSWVGVRGGRAELMYRYAYHICVAGETIMVGTEQDDNGVNLGITWEMLSTQEIHMQPGMPVYRRRDGTGGQGAGEVLPDTSYLARSWRSDVRFSDRASSGVQRVLTILQELVILTQLVDAQIKSRLSASMLLVPDEISFSPEDNEATDDDESYGEDAIDPLSRRLMQHMSAPVENRESAASLVPLLLRGPGENLAQVKLVPLTQDSVGWAQQLRDECIERLAAGLDIPPEVLKGTGGLNHWGGWQVDIQFVVKHVKPIGDLLADFLTDAYLRPMLEVFEDMDPADSARFKIEFDVNPILSAADESNIARALYDRDAITQAALVRHSGFDDGDVLEPGSPEWVAKVAIALITRNANIAPYLLHLVPGFEKIKIDIGLGVRTANTIESAPNEPTAPAAPQPAPTPAAPSGTGQPPAAPESGPPGMSMLINRVAAAADGAVERALEKAGSQLANRARADRGLRDVLADRFTQVDKLDFLTKVSPSEMSRMKTTYRDLFAGAWDRLTPKVAGWVTEYLEAGGMERFMAADMGEMAAAELGKQLDGLVTANPHRRLAVGPNGLRVPDGLVETALSMAAGMADRLAGASL